MAAEKEAALLLIYIDETDTWGDSRVPLYEAIVEKLFELGIDGATVQTGIMGYGANRRVHRKRLFGVTDDRPVIISAVDGEHRLR
jgi:PII-like signaling protein